MPVNTTNHNSELSDRQRREVDYYSNRSLRYKERFEAPVDMEFVLSERKRWWNAYWRMVALLRDRDLRNSRVLVVGSGYGEDAIRLSHLAARVDAFDLSPDCIAIARKRAERDAKNPVFFECMACEQLEYDDDTFDLILCVNILHHVDVASTMSELQRVACTGCTFLANEIYTHAALQRIRDSAIVGSQLHRLLIPWTYGTTSPHITPDERKLNQADIRILRAHVRVLKEEYFEFLHKRLLPRRWKAAARFDRLLLKILGRYAGRILGGRLLLLGEFDGPIRSRAQQLRAEGVTLGHVAG